MTGENNDNKSYNAEDILKYVSGKMSAAEMHALEKRALEDPFLADAIEGMESRQAELVQQDFADLRKRLNHRVTRKKVIIAPIFKVAAAAAVFLLAGSLSIMYFLNRGSKAGPETMVNEVQSSAAPTPQPSLRADTVSSQSAELVLRKTDAPENDKLLKSKPVREINQVPVVESKAAQPDLDYKQEELSKSLAISPALADSLPQKDMAVRKMQQEAANQSAMRQAPSMAPAMSKAKREMMAPGEVAPIEPYQTTGFSPANRWEGYGRYLDSAKSRLVVSGRAILQFRINHLGQAREIKVLSSSNPSVNSEIIRLIENGALWRIDPGRDSTAKVLIRF